MMVAHLLVLSPWLRPFCVCLVACDFEYFESVLEIGLHGLQAY